MGYYAQAVCRAFLGASNSSNSNSKRAATEMLGMSERSITDLIPDALDLSIPSIGLLLHRYYTTVPPPMRVL